MKMSELMKQEYEERCHDGCGTYYCFYYKRYTKLCHKNEDYILKETHGVNVVVNDNGEVVITISADDAEILLRNRRNFSPGSVVSHIGDTIAANVELVPITPAAKFEAKSKV